MTEVTRYIPGGAKEKLTVIRASYCNPEETAIVLFTEESGAVAISKVDNPETWEEVERLIDVQPYTDQISYIEKRREAYPPLGDQLDALMKWLATETEFAVPTELKSIAMKCMAVKARYPKE